MILTLSLQPYVVGDYDFGNMIKSDYFVHYFEIFFLKKIILGHRSCEEVLCEELAKSSDSRETYFLVYEAFS